MRLKSIVAGVVLIFLSGCTIKGQLVSHTPLLERGKPKNIELFVCDFEDGRQNKKTIGIFTVYGFIPLAKVQSPPGYIQAITDCFKTELKHTGYQIVDESNEARYKIMGKVIKIYGKQDLFSSAKIEIEIALYGHSELLFKKVYSNRISSSSDSGALASIGFQRILTELIKDLEASCIISTQDASERGKVKSICTLKSTVEGAMEEVEMKKEADRDNNLEEIKKV